MHAPYRPWFMPGLGLWLSAGLASANGVLEWNGLMIDAIRVDNSGPTLSTRNLALLHTSIYDAVNSVTRTHQPYRFQPAIDPATSAEAAVATAGHAIVQVLYPAFAARADELRDTQLAALSRNQAWTNGAALGRQIAQAMLDARASDGAGTLIPYIPSADPGQWRRTPPFFRPPLDPHWGSVTPFCLPELEPFLPPPPPRLDSPEYAAALNEVKALGARNSTVRTPYQDQTAVFWSDFSYTAMPSGHWHEIAATIASQRHSTLEESARLFALLGLAQADAVIVCWETKYRYNLWRPITAIQRADEDNNPDTERDVAWDHRLGSPPFPAYPSGHSTLSKAGAQVLTDFCGTDAVTFTTGSDSLPGVFRTFTSLRACAEEAGMSRIYGGIHFSFDNHGGRIAGRGVADFVMANFLLPNSSLPRLTSVPVRFGANPQFRLHGRTGTTLVLESSTDLRTWIEVGIHEAQLGGTPVTLEAAGGSRMFRVRER